MPFSWPNSLVHELAERRCVPILGAGISMAAKNGSGESPPSWSNFLHNALYLLSGRPLSDAQSLISQQKYLDAAQILVHEANPADFHDYVRAALVNPTFQPAKIHETIASLDAKIVITTNYDRIYDQYCESLTPQPGFNVCRYYETHAPNDLRSTTRLILKIHGCVTNVAAIVLTRTQYFTARRDYPQFYNLLDALFLTSTLLFLGCGLNDPDLNLLLETARLRSTTMHPHYAIVDSDPPAAIEMALVHNHNIKLLKYPSGQHHLLQAKLLELSQLVVDWRATH